MNNINSDIQHGFLLTRSSKDKNGSTEIEYWIATESGPILLKIKGERPVLFIATSELERTQKAIINLRGGYEIKPLDLMNFDHQSVSAIYSPNIRASFQLQEHLKLAGIEALEADFRLHDRYLMERFTYAGVAFTGQTIEHDGYREVKDALIKPSKFRTALNALSLDIECAMDGELFSVGLASTGSDSKRFVPVSEVLMIGEPQLIEELQPVVEPQPEQKPQPIEKHQRNKESQADRKQQLKKNQQSNTLIHWFADEKSLLKGLCQRISHIDPDLIIGWNIINFDFRVLVERAAAHKTSLRIGRANSIATWRSRRDDPRKGYVTIPGRVAIDGIDALRSATWQFPSFSLEAVSQTLLGRGKKVNSDVDDRIAEIVHNFNYNKPALAAYNLEDCQLVLDIFEHTNIIDYLILRSELTGLELDRAGGSVAAFTNLYLPKLHRGGFVAPNLPVGGGLASPGGYVMDSKPGLYKNVLVLDFKSLYPSIIRTFKVDPMGLIIGLSKPKDSIEGFKGARFDREQHYLPDIITHLWQQRDQAKKDNDSTRSQAIKIIMNSFYGVLGSGGCRFYDTRLASSITMRGHEIMQTTSKWIEQRGYGVIYGDTDSIFVLLDEDTDASTCRKIGSELAQTINQAWYTTLKDGFNLECHLEIEFETHFSRFLMPTIRKSNAGSKKRYAGLIINEKTQEDKIIFKGLENVRTDWTDLAKQFQATLFELVFHDQDPSQAIISTVKQTLSGSLDDMLIYRKQLRKKLHHYVKNVPPQVRAARIADEKNAAAGRSLRYQNKGWINYVMTVNGPEAIEYLSSPIDYNHYVEKQLKPIADGILPFIDLDFDSLTSHQITLF